MKRKRSYSDSTINMYVKGFLKYANNTDFKKLQIQKVDSVEQLSEDDYEKIADLVEKSSMHRTVHSAMKFNGVSLIGYDQLNRHKSLVERLTEIETDYCTFLLNTEIDKALELCDSIKLKLQEGKLSAKEKAIKKLKVETTELATELATKLEQIKQLEESE